MGFVLRHFLDGETPLLTSQPQVEQALDSALRSCSASRVHDFLLQRGQVGSGKRLEATSVLRNHFSRWALKNGRMTRDAFPEFFEARYDVLVAQSELVRAFAVDMAETGGNFPGTLSSESRGNACRVVTRFLRWVAKENFPELARQEVEPDYGTRAGELDALLTQKLDFWLKAYCRLRNDGGVHESKQGLIVSRSVLYKYFVRVVPGGEKIVRPSLCPKRERKPTVKHAEPKEARSTETRAPDPPSVEVTSTEPIEIQASSCQSEVVVRYDLILERALTQLSLALRVPRHELGGLRLNDVRELNYRLRVFIHNIPSLARRGANYIDLDGREAYQAVHEYIELCRKRPPRKAFFFETFEAQPLPAGKGKRR